jgi:hypothetical protein
MPHLAVTCGDTAHKSERTEPGLWPTRPPHPGDQRRGEGAVFWVESATETSSWPLQTWPARGVPLLDEYLDFVAGGVGWTRC